MKNVAATLEAVAAEIEAAAYFTSPQIAALAAAVDALRDAADEQLSLALVYAVVAVEGLANPFGRRDGSNKREAFAKINAALALAHDRAPAPAAEKAPSPLTPEEASAIAWDLGRVEARGGGAFLHIERARDRMTVGEWNAFLAIFAAERKAVRDGDCPLHEASYARSCAALWAGYRKRK